jgi:hypothetical protein
MSEMLQITRELAASRLLLLIGNEQESSNYRGDEIDHQAFEWLHYIRKGGDVIHQ